MMLRGISFTLVKDTDFWDIIRFIGRKCSYWRVVAGQTEVWDRTDDSDFFTHENYTTGDLQDIMLKNGYIIFLKMVASAISGKIPDVEDYGELLKSDSAFVVLVNDCVFVEIYCKNEADAEELLSQMNCMGYADAELITDLNDRRKRFCVI